MAARNLRARLEEESLQQLGAIEGFRKNRSLKKFNEHHSRAHIALSLVSAYIRYRTCDAKEETNRISLMKMVNRGAKNRS